MVSRQLEMSTCLSRWGSACSSTTKSNNAAVVEPHGRLGSCRISVSGAAGRALPMCRPQAGEFVLPVHVAVGSTSTDR